MEIRLLDIVIYVRSCANEPAPATLETMNECTILWLHTVSGCSWYPCHIYAQQHSIGRHCTLPNDPNYHISSSVPTIKTLTSAESIKFQVLTNVSVGLFDAIVCFRWSFACHQVNMSTRSLHSYAREISSLLLNQHALIPLQF
jgi:hypothetical protein